MHRFPISSVAALLWVSSLAAPVRGETIAPDRRTTWNPGIPGGIPVRTTVCATLEASAYGNGLADATPGIQAAIDACPEGQVVRLSAGRFLGVQPRRSRTA